ncbi:MAG TPA: low affinity iron permease family protein, partial [Jatrophihabitans sp.]
MIDDIASRPLVALVLVSLDLLWVVLSSAFEFPDGLDSVFQTLVAAVILAMVFVIQHTQSREQVVLQRKPRQIGPIVSDETPRTDNSPAAVADARRVLDEIRWPAAAQTPGGLLRSGATDRAVGPVESTVQLPDCLMKLMSPLVSSTAHLMSSSAAMPSSRAFS